MSCRDKFIFFNPYKYLEYKDDIIFDNCFAAFAKINLTGLKDISVLIATKIVGHEDYLGPLSIYQIWMERVI